MVLESAGKVGFRFCIRHSGTEDTWELGRTRSASPVQVSARREVRTFLCAEAQEIARHVKFALSWVRALARAKEGAFSHANAFVPRKMSRLRLPARDDVISAKCKSPRGSPQQHAARHRHALEHITLLAHPLFLRLYPVYR